MNIFAGDTTSSVGLPRMRAKTARWASRDDSKAGDELGGRNTWLLVVVGGVSIRTRLFLVPALGMRTRIIRAVSLARITYAYGCCTRSGFCLFFCFFVFFVFLSFCLFVSFCLVLSLFLWFFVAWCVQ